MELIYERLDMVAVTQSQLLSLCLDFRLFNFSVRNETMVSSVGWVKYRVRDSCTKLDNKHKDTGQKILYSVF